MVTGMLPRLIHRVRSLTRLPVTLGAQLMLIDDSQQVLLVKPRYAPRWQFPGGAVDAGETAVAAALRETQEETGVAVLGEPTLFGLYFNEKLNSRDHVALFQLQGHQPLAPSTLKGPSAEIAAVCLAPLDQLPDDTAAGTRRRLSELAGTPRSRLW